MAELIAHLFGDYILQSDKLAKMKTKSILFAFLHGFLYTLPFLFISGNITALLIIFISHSLIDRYGIGAKISQLKNWYFETKDGFDFYTPRFLAIWLVIITDNTIHLTINHLALSIK